MASTTTSPLSLRSSSLLLPSSSYSITSLHDFFTNRSQSRLFFSVKPFPSLSLQNPKTPKITSSSSSSSSPSSFSTATAKSSLAGSTRSLATLAALTLAVARALSQKLTNHGISALRFSLAAATATASPIFFASLRDRPPGHLNTPLTVVAVGIKKWLDIYSGVLMVRVLLSWFPNIPWERQPLSAIRDLCDPYLNLFRNIIPPIFDTLDVSPLLAFAVLGTLGSIVQGSLG
ncbi:unnamed protein product [Cochlearia groenlandica]